MMRGGREPPAAQGPGATHRASAPRRLCDPGRESKAMPRGFLGRLHHIPAKQPMEEHKQKPPEEDFLCSPLQAPENNETPSAHAAEDPMANARWAEVPLVVFLLPLERASPRPGGNEPSLQNRPTRWGGMGFRTSEPPPAPGCLGHAPAGRTGMRLWGHRAGGTAGAHPPAAAPRLRGRGMPRGGKRLLLPKQIPFSPRRCASNTGRAKPRAGTELSIPSASGGCQLRPPLRGAAGSILEQHQSPAGGR